MHRWLCDNKRLRGEAGRRSKVAYRVQFYVRPKFQQQGLAKQLLPQEEDLFLSWGARQIQTDAMDTGRWVWTRSEFGYAVQDVPIREPPTTVQRLAEVTRCESASKGN